MRLFLLFENWFTYDADNRVDVDGGDLVSGQIQVVARTGSVEKKYNLAGDVVTEVSNDGTGNKTQFFDYDARGDQVGSTLTNIFLRIHPNGVEWGEFVQNATLGLIEAADHYDPARGVEFRTFARHRVRGAVFDGLREIWDQHLVSPTREADRSESLDSEQSDPLESFVSWTVGLGIGHLLDSAASLDLAGPSRTPYAELEQNQIQILLRQAVDLLPERERLIVTMHYFQHIAFTEIASYLGVTKGRVSQLHRQGIGRLRLCLREYVKEISY